MTTRAEGLLVSVDGPGGVGKTATVEHLVAMLGRAGLPVHRTAQPSASLRPVPAPACIVRPQSIRATTE